MKKKLSALAVVAVLGVIEIFGQSKVGTTSASFLGIGIGTRAVSMGGAFTAMYDDPTMLYWNPAAIARNRGVQTSFVHSNWLIDTRIAWAGVTANFGEAGAIGASINLLTSGDMERTTEEQDEGTGEFFSASFLSLQFTYSRALTDKFSVGATLKYNYERLYNVSASSVAVDLGVLFLINSNFRLAATMSNYGSAMRLFGNDLLFGASSGTGLNGENPGIPAQYLTDEWNIPLIFRIGIAADLINSKQNRLTLALDGISPNDNELHANLGMEYAWRELLYLRAGYNQLFLEFSETGLTLGGGLRYNIGFCDLRVDYTYQYFGRLNAPQWLSLGLIF
jgi:long-subunit fatty acid transport protein